MDYKIKISLVCILFFAISSFAQPKPDDIFGLLNLNYPGLEKVEAAVVQNDLSTAKSELLIYFQNRKNVKSEIGNKNYRADIVRADMNSKNIFDIKTIKYDFGEKIDWTKVHADKEWQFSFGRMKWFENYIAAYMQTNDDKYVKAWMNQFESWTKLNDPGYPRTIDTGRRMENLTQSYWMFIQVLKAKSVTPEFNALLLTSMYEQAEYQYNPDNWRRYSNWGTFENSGFAIFATLFPEFKRSNNWMKELFFRMRTQLQNSFYEDGMHVETSPSYHSNELEVWFDFIKLVELNNIGDPWSPQVEYATFKELIVPKAFALMNLYKPTGFIPQLGDTDWRDERDLFQKIGEYFDVPELKYFASDGKEGVAPQYRSIVYPQGGYATLRSGWGDEKLDFSNELYLVFDFGNNKPWHAHYDIFNVLATAYGYDLLIDPGRFTYNDGEDREAFKSTGYHNTIEVDSKNQKRNYKAPVITNYFLNDFDYLQGVQNSYDGVEHSRSILFAGKEYWIIVDKLSSDSKHTYNQNWHLAHESFGKVEVNENRIVAPHMLMLFSDKSNVSVKSSFQSRSYRKKIEIPVVENSAENVDKVILPTVIYPYDTEMPSMKISKIALQKNSEESGVVAMKIESKKFKDFYFERNSNENMFIDNDIETDSKVVFIKENNSNEVTQILMIQGSYLKYKNNVLVSIKGKKTNISIAKGVISIDGDCVTDFTINIHNTNKVYLNSKEIKTEIVDGKVNYFSENSND